METSQLRIGVIGLGRAFAVMTPTFLADPRVVVAGGADPDPSARARFQHQFKAPSYENIEELCADASIHVIYIATPHQFHAEHACLAAAHGKHVLVEKPIALSLQECDRMIQAAKAAKTHLIVGPTHSFDGPILRCRSLIESGRFGEVKMISAINYTDFVYRPRRAEEFVTEQGGGVVFNQAAHQMDVIRLLGGGMVSRVRSYIGAWDSERPMQGAYSALLGFESGAHASAVYSGYAHYDTDILMDNIRESGRPKAHDGYGEARKRLRAAASSPGSALDSQGRRDDGSSNGPTGGDIWYPHFGHVVVSCERADLRPTPKGVEVYEDSKKYFEPLPAPSAGRTEVINELYDCVFGNIAPRHSGEWGRATLEVCLGMLASAREGRDIKMYYQIPY